jgi:alpha-amylase
MMAMAAQAQIKVYVEADEAPYIWAWNAEGDVIPTLMGPDYGWPGYQLTETFHHEFGTDFWVFTFPAEVLPVNILFNNGNGDQTSDINGIKTDRYFQYDGTNGWVDVSESYGVEIPDAEVTKVTLKGNMNDESWQGPELDFDVVEAGKVFSITVNADDYSFAENLWKFKFRPNGQDWVGYWDVYYDEEPVEGKAPKTDAPEWLSEDGGNFMIDLEGTTERLFTFTVTWGGGKEAGKNWAFKAEIANPAGISAAKAENANATVRYNLQGQRVQNNYRGIAIQNGKKLVVK